MSTTLEPISRQSTAEIIADQLRDAITNGSFPPGSQMTETGLADQLGVSRGPLREAMQRLVQEGLLRSEIHRGLFVNELTPDDIRDVYATRTMIEREACSLILDRSADISPLNSLVRDMRDAVRRGDAHGRSENDFAFHRALVERSGSPRLIRMTETLLVETRMCIAALEDKYHAPDDIVDEHAIVVNALRDRDLDTAHAAVETHMTEGLARLVPGS